MNTNILTTSLIWSLCLVQVSLASSTFSDGVFDPLDWDLTVVVNDNGGGNVPVQQINSGGNPDEFRRVTTFVETTTAGHRSTIFGFHEFKSSIYDPSVSGAIASLDFSIDFMNIDVHGNGQGFALAVEQGGDIYFAGVNHTTAAGFMLNTWQSLSTPEIVASDFELVDLSVDNLRDPTIHPDFSSSGSPIVFGFHTRDTIPPNVPVGIFAELDVGYDNWSVEITPVPEPTTCTLALVALSWAIGRRR